MIRKFPGWTRYVAQNRCGTLIAFNQIPSPNDDTGEWELGKWDVRVGKSEPIIRLVDNIGWKDTLMSFVPERDFGSLTQSYFNKK